MSAYMLTHTAWCSMPQTTTVRFLVVCPNLHIQNLHVQIKACLYGFDRCKFWTR